MSDAQSLLIGLSSTIAILALVWAWFSYFPKALGLEFRIKEKKVGKFQYYKPQVKRPFFGWSAFYASTNDGSISHVGSWDKDKGSAVEQIKNYQDLRS